jgi:hypothetical protein
MTVRLLAACAVVAPSLPARAQYKGFHAAITKQLSPIKEDDNAIVELGTLIPKEYELRFKSLKVPQGIVFKSLQSPAGGCVVEGKNCRQHFTMAVDAHTSGKCNLTGDYVASFDVACTDAKDASCKPGTHEVAFTLNSENFCTAKTVDTSGMWQQIPGMFAGDIGAGAGEDMWIVDFRKSVPGGYDVVSLNLNKTVGMRRNGGAVRIDLDGGGNAFVVNDKGEIYRSSGQSWNRLPGIAKDIGVGPNGTAWHIGNNAVPGGFGIYRWNGKSWDNIKGGAVRIDVDPKGNAWVVNDAGTVFRWSGSDWLVVPGVTARDVGIGANGSVFVAGKDGIVSKWDGKAWTRRGGSRVTDITVTASGVPIALNESHEIWVGQP